MSALAAQSLIHSEAQAIDDCWNRIGIYGDKSCPLLPQHIHCRNCGTYAAAATRLLDRYSFEQQGQELYAPQAHEQKVATCSLVVFRLGEEWLGLPTRCLDEVAPIQTIHSLPHQRSRALRGVANVRGTLVPCLSLVELLGLDPAEPGASSLRVQRLAVETLGLRGLALHITEQAQPVEDLGLRVVPLQELLARCLRLAAFALIGQGGNLLKQHARRVG